MSQQPDLIEKQERPTEGKYKYLVDMTRNQFSPNLRKYYNDSFSKGSNSEQIRQSSQLNSHDRRSSSHHKLNQRNLTHPYSPSCNTFNPRRETTQEQFSPYDQGDKQDDRLNQQLLQENAFLKSQLSESSQLIDQLKIELSKRQSDILKIQQMSQADLRYFEKVVTEMTNQIQLVLTKNKILQNQLIVVKTRLQQELKRQEQYLRHEQQKKRIQDYRKRDELRYLHQARTQVQPRRSTPQPISKRSVGKLMSRPLANKQNHQTLKTSKIKIQEDSESLNQSHFESTKNQQNKTLLSQIGKQNRQGQSLINSIKSMQIKITGEQSSSLKQLWKWLKGMGQSQSYLKKWKNKATEAVPYSSTDKLKELIRQACSYIQ